MNTVQTARLRQRQWIYLCGYDCGFYTHKLKSSDATKENYPFDFELKIKHVLEKNQVSVCWEVVNHSNETMYFTIGGHPAFNVPAQGNDSQKEDYLLTFNGEKSLTYLLLDPASGTLFRIRPKHWSLQMEPVILMPICLTTMLWSLTTRLKKPVLLFLTELLIWNLTATVSRTLASVCAWFFFRVSGTMDGKMWWLRLQG